VYNEVKPKHNFDIGDEVICIDTGGNEKLFLGDVFTVFSAPKSYHKKKHIIGVTNSEGMTFRYWNIRFERVGIPAVQLPEELFTL
jgi:hypothetical protein